jgi:hypothetical protein
MDKFCDIRVVSMVNYFALPTSSLDCHIVGDYLKVVIRDEGLYAGMSSPGGNFINNNNSYRYIEVMIDDKGEVVEFEGYINSGYGFEYFEKDSIYALGAIVKDARVNTTTIKNFIK